MCTSPCLNRNHGQIGLLTLKASIDSNRPNANLFNELSVKNKISPDLNYVKSCLDLLQFNFNHKTRNVCNLNPDINPIAKYLYGILLKVELTLSNILDMSLS